MNVWSTTFWNPDDGWDEQKRLVEAILREYPDVILPQVEQEKKRSRKTTARQDYWMSVWGKMLTNPEIEDPESFVARKFRRRFRVPYPLFKEVILPQCVSHNIFETKRECGGTIPIEFKLLIALRILGRDAVADDCSELSFVGESTCHFIFKQFVSNYSRAFYSEYVKFPTAADFMDTMETYRRVGFPGCVGSIDCTHIKWAACAKDKKWKATGKEGYPTLSFQAIVSHDRRCLHISIAFLGSYNDITISKNDVCVQEIVAGSMADVEFILYNEDGVPELCSGGYLLADNGYLKQSVFMCPWKTPSCRQELLWSEWAESVRKDVECFFGLLKARWWYLRNGIRYHSAAVIQDAFMCAGILHNMLLAYDGFLATGQRAWENLNPDEADDEAFFESDIDNEDDNEAYDMPVVNGAGVTTMQQLQQRRHLFRRGPRFNPVRDFTVLRRALVVHFSHQYGIGDLWWPRSLDKKRRVTLRIPAIDVRVLAASNAALYHMPSDLRARDSNGQTYTSRIGDGLFSSLAYKAGDTICTFSGEIISSTERARRTAAGRGGYMLHLNRLQCLDCYDHYLAGKCKASYANSPRMVRYHNDPARAVHANAVLKVNTQRKTHTLVATCSLESQVEILWSYQSAYVYPTPEN